MATRVASSVQSRTLPPTSIRQVNSPRLQDKWSDAYAEREAVEWELADLIVCGSAFVRAALEKVGVDGGKIHVVPYGTDLPTSSVQVRLGDSRPKTPLRLLFVGNDGLRKGLPYLLEALRGFRKDTVELSVAGDLRLPPELLRKDDDRIQYLGFIDRASMDKVYQQADVFVLPSLCEGSATVVYEAMAYGLPVICTENTGSVVQHRQDGWIVPVRDVSALRHAIEAFIEEPQLVEMLRRRAYLTAQRHTVSEYGEKLRRAILTGTNYPDGKKDLKISTSSL